MIIKYLFNRVRLAFRNPATAPTSQGELAQLVERSIGQEIRQGYTHRFITLMFVAVGDRVFCRRYSYGEPSWHGAFLKNPEGQVKLDKTIVNITASVPADLDEVNPSINDAYERKLKEYGASHMLTGATEPRALASTLELKLNPGAEGAS